MDKKILEKKIIETGEEDCLFTWYLWKHLFIAECSHSWMYTSYGLFLGPLFVGFCTCGNFWFRFALKDKKTEAYPDKKIFRVWDW